MRAGRTPWLAAAVGVAVVVSANPQSGSGIWVLVSLHGLEPNASYRASGNRKGCGVVDAADYVVWRKGFKTRSDDDVYATTTTEGAPRAALDARSIRIEVLDADGSTNQVACGQPFSFKRY